MARPKKAPEDRKSTQISVRLTQDLRERLERARTVDQPTRTLSQEIEYRLLRSFSEPDRFDDSLGGATSAWFLRALGDMIRASEIETGKRWFQDRFTHEQCAEAARLWFAEFVPAGRRIKPKWKQDFVRDRHGNIIPGRMACGRPAPTAPETRVAMARANLEAYFDAGVPPAPFHTNRHIAAGRLVPKMKDTPKQKRGSKK